MEATNSTTFSSALFRQRDKAMEDKHKKELDTLNHKVAKLKRANDETLKDLFDLRNRGDRLARSLGFKDLHDAQVAVDTADTVMSYKEFLEQREQLEGDLAAELSKNEGLHETITTLNLEQEKLKASVASAERNLKRTQSEATRQQARADRITSELDQLKLRYDTLSDVRERCALQFKRDYTKWKNMKDWIFDDSGIEGLDLSAKEKKDRMNALVKEKKQIVKDYHARNDPTEPLPHPPFGGTEPPEENEEDESTPSQKRRRSPSPGLRPSSPSPTESSANVKKRNATPPPSRVSLFKPGTNEILSSSPTIFNGGSARQTTSGSRKPLAFAPVIKQTPKKWTPSIPNQPSSQTEEESPEPSNGTKRSHIPTSPASSPPHMASSQTEPESQSQIFPFPLTFPTKNTPRPLIMKTIAPQTAPTRMGSAVVSRDAETLQPIKMRKLTDLPATSPRRRLSRPSAVNTHTPSQARKPLGSKENRPFLVPSSTPLNTTNRDNPKPGDYSAFKGRGRYAKEAATGKNTINAQYMIDPVQNGGVKFQFEDVVRNKRERQQMNAGDCESCRDYYQAIGPLPERLQAPLWRSPRKDKTKVHIPPCRHHSGNSEADKSTSDEAGTSDMYNDAIGAHQKAISRHRHHWARANTPPGYWEIGFPDTQEAEDINERAKEMHEQKRKEVDAAARREGGRYRRRT